MVFSPFNCNSRKLVQFDLNELIRTKLLGSCPHFQWQQQSAVAESVFIYSRLALHCPCQPVTRLSHGSSDSIEPTEKYPLRVKHVQKPILDN